MRAFVMRGHGPCSGAKLGDLPIPELLPGYVLVRIAAAAVNPTDWKEMEGNLRGFYPPYPDRWAPGFDGSGVVEAVGDGVARFAPGDRVVFLADRREVMTGTFAEYCLVAEDHAARVPGSISLADSACLPVAGITAYQALFHKSMGQAKAGQSVLIHGAAGGIGSFSTGFAKASGLRIAATARPANFNYVRELGASIVIDYAQGDIPNATRQWLSGGGVDLVIDAFSGGRDSSLLDTLTTGGRLVTVATVTHDADLAALEAEASRRGVSSHFLIMDHATLSDDLAAMGRLIDGGNMRMPEISRYPLDRAAEAVATMKAGKVRGKIIIDVADLPNERA